MSYEGKARSQIGNRSSSEGKTIADISEIEREKENNARESLIYIRFREYWGEWALADWNHITYYCLFIAIRFMTNWRGRQKWDCKQRRPCNKCHSVRKCCNFLFYNERRHVSGSWTWGRTDFVIQLVLQMEIFQLVFGIPESCKVNKFSIV